MEKEKDGLQEQFEEAKKVKDGKANDTEKHIPDVAWGGSKDSSDNSTSNSNNNSKDNDSFNVYFSLNKDIFDYRKFYDSDVSADISDDDSDVAQIRHYIKTYNFNNKMYNNRNDVSLRYNSWQFYETTLHEIKKMANTLQVSQADLMRYLVRFGLSNLTETKEVKDDDSDTNSEKI